VLTNDFRLVRTGQEVLGFRENGPIKQVFLKDSQMLGVLGVKSPHPDEIDNAEICIGAKLRTVKHTRYLVRSIPDKQG